MLLKDPGFLLKDPGVLLKDPGDLLVEPGVLLKDPGVLLKDPPRSLATTKVRLFFWPPRGLPRWGLGRCRVLRALRRFVRCLPLGPVHGAIEVRRSSAPWPTRGVLVGRISFG